MRPHTRTQCQDGNQCPECKDPPQNSSNHNSTLQNNFSTISGTNNAESAGGSSLASYVSGASSSVQSARFDASGASSTSVGASNLDDPFVAPKGTVSRRSATSGSGIFSMSGSSMFAFTSHQSKSSQSQGSSLSLANGDARAMLIVELPAEILFKILNYMSFKEISYLRMVSRRFNEICASMLNSTFQRFQSQMLSRFQEIKTQMPRRESARRNHPLAQECDVVETLHMRLSLLEMTFGKHIDRKHVCFFAGEILDEVQRIMRYIRHTPNQHPRNPKNPYIYMEDELFDLSTMAMEYFKEHIEPTLPEITYFGADFLDFTSFGSSSPPKRRSVSGSTTTFAGLESPCSSRASVAGSSVSEAWSSASTSATEMSRAMDMEAGPSHQPPQSNMVLRKRIRRIRQGMKRYNEQLIEYKKELKTCKTKLETQSKQVQEYSQRTEQYDQKFSEVSNKFQTLLTELNKCKIELQYWRSKSTTLLALPSTCASCSAPLDLPSQSPENVEAEIKALANQGIFLTEDLTMTQELNSVSDKNTVSDSNSILDVQKQPQIQPDLIEDQQPEETLSSIDLESNPPSPKTRGQPLLCKSGPPSPVSAVGRKRKSRDDLGTVSPAGDLAALAPTTSGDLNDLESKRKSSLRGGNTAVASGSGSGSPGSTSATVKNTRIKRPKISTAS